jgi:hypothetical protein
MKKELSVEVLIFLEQSGYVSPQLIGQQQFSNDENGSHLCKLAGLYLRYYLLLQLMLQYFIALVTRINLNLVS